jgi:hypothetical protein
VSRTNLKEREREREREGERDSEKSFKGVIRAQYTYILCTISTGRVEDVRV